MEKVELVTLTKNKFPKGSAKVTDSPMPSGGFVGFWQIVISYWLLVIRVIGGHLYKYLATQ